MIEIIILIVGIFVLSGIFWHSIFYQKEKKLLNRLQQMLDCSNRWRTGTDRSIRRKVFCS